MLINPVSPIKTAWSNSVHSAVTLLCWVNLYSTTLMRAETLGIQPVLGCDVARLHATGGKGKVRKKDEYKEESLGRRKRRNQGIWVPIWQSVGVCCKLTVRSTVHLGVSETVLARLHPPMSPLFQGSEVCSSLSISPHPPWRAERPDLSSE